MRRMDERMTDAAELPRPVDLAFCNGLGILMRERRRLNRRENQMGQELIPTISDRLFTLMTGHSFHRTDTGKNGAR